MEPITVSAAFQERFKAVYAAKAARSALLEQVLTFMMTAESESCRMERAIWDDLGQTYGFSLGSGEFEFLPGSGTVKEIKAEGTGR